MSMEGILKYEDMPLFYEIIPSDLACPNYLRVTDPKFKSHWFSIDPNPHLIVHFKKERILLSGYQIRTYAGDSNSAHLKSWIVEGSNDGENWDPVHLSQDCSALNSPKSQCQFEFNPSGPYSHIRLKMVGKNHANGLVMVVSRFQLLGSIVL